MENYVGSSPPLRSLIADIPFGPICRSPVDLLPSLIPPFRFLCWSGIKCWLSCEAGMSRAGIHAELHAAVVASGPCCRDENGKGEHQTQACRTSHIKKCSFEWSWQPLSARCHVLCTCVSEPPGPDVCSLRWMEWSSVMEHGACVCPLTFPLLHLGRLLLVWRRLRLTCVSNRIWNLLSNL